MELLNTVMKKEVLKRVKSYQTDLDYDFEALLDKKEPVNEYIWLLRDCGTNLFRLPNVLVEGCSCFLEYYLNSNEKGLKFFKITVEKKAAKNVYGEIEEIKTAKLKKYLAENRIPLSKVDSVEYTVFTDDKKPFTLSLAASENEVKYIDRKLGLDNYRLRYTKFNIRS